MWYWYVLTGALSIIAGFILGVMATDNFNSKQAKNNADAREIEMNIREQVKRQVKMN